MPTETHREPDDREYPLDAIGVGPIPATMMRFNWGAFFLPALWGFVYGIWPLVGLWFVASFAPVFLSIIVGMFSRGTTLSPSSLIGIAVVSDTLLAYVRLWTGASANRLYWERESRRLAAKPEALPREGVAGFTSRQWIWMVLGIAGAVAGLVITLPASFEAMKPYGLQWAFIVEPIVFLIAQLTLGAWLAYQMRAEFTGVPNGNGDVFGADDASEDDDQQWPLPPAPPQDGE